MDKPGLSYNTEREQIVISEYGRCVQEMIKKLPEIEDRKERTDAARYIISVMVQMNPSIKQSSDYEHKLWDHLYMISGYNLDLDSPFAPPIPVEQQKRPQHIGYQNNNIKYGHYGQYLIKMIEAAAAEPNDDIREALAYSLAGQMKRNYLEWNKSVVNDQVIIDDLKTISNGRLVISDESKLNATGEMMGKMQPQAKQQQQGKKKKKKVPNLKANMNNPNNPAYKKRMQELGKL
ncbi:MAG: DUF4290 domain-containing protein [Bacteroidales bacterium]|nr:DUF4290 domain-containing protein [Bacteroidales bacterium]